MSNSNKTIVNNTKDVIKSQIENSTKSKNNNKPITNKLKNTKEAIQSKLENSAKAISNTAKKTSNVIKEEVEKTKKSVKKTIDGSKTIQNTKSKLFEISSKTKDFAEKNSTVTKVVFILFMFVLFGLLIRLGVFIISLFLTTEKNPIVIDGTLATTSMTVYEINPNMKNSKAILRSINENQGMEYTWSSWIYIENPTSGSESIPKRFFSKGKSINKSKSLDPDKNINFLMNSPGLYLWDNTKSSSYENCLTIVVNKYNDNYNTADDYSTENNFTEIISIPNIPIQKWVNVIIRIQNRTIDIYINGILTIRKSLNYVIKQNYGDIYVGDNKNGASGHISSLRYFSYAIGNNKIQDIINQGPNLKLIDNNCNNGDNKKYLSSNWYSDSLY